MAARRLLVLALFFLVSPCAILLAQTPANFKIAFIGDQGSGRNGLAVLNLIKNEGAKAVVHSGDFDYRDNPRAWDDQINSILGTDFPYFASIGNHDDSSFYGVDGYQSFLIARMNRQGVTWDGDLGVKSSFNYKGIFFLLTGADVLGSDHDIYIRDKLAADRSIWSISSWHKNMKAMQVGGKGNETGWGVYEESRKGGAIIATSHEHSYQRTHLLSSCQNQTVASTSDTLVVTKDRIGTVEDEGRTFVFVSGLGGQSIRDQERCLPSIPPYGCNGEWASIYTSTQAAAHGALFGIFNYNGNTRLAHFYFKAINGVVPDDFYVLSHVEDSDVTVDLNPTDDSYVRGGSYASRNYNLDNKLRLREAKDRNNDYYVYLKFDLGKVIGAITSATLKLYCQGRPSNSPAMAFVYSVPIDTWSETTITRNNAPAAGRLLSSRKDISTVGEVYTFDVTNFAVAEMSGDKVITLMLKDDAVMNRVADFGQRENSDPARRPTLVVVSGARKFADPAETNVVAIPATHYLEQNYPNPFHLATEIRFQLPSASQVTVKIFNLIGEEVWTLSAGPQEAGYHSVRWDGKDRHGNPVANGVYFYQLQADNISEMRTMSLLRPK
ncbi:MAG: DUF7594 domain-containing protein [bacterium]